MSDDPYREALEGAAKPPPATGTTAPEQEQKIPLRELPPVQPPRKDTTPSPKNEITKEIDAILGRDDVSAEERAGTIRTYESDLAETIKGEHLSLAGIALAESRRRAGAPAGNETPPLPWWRNKKTLLVVAASAVLLLVGGSVLVFIAVSRGDATPANLFTDHQPPILSNNTETRSTRGLFRDTLLDTLEEASAGTRGTLGDITDIVLTIPDAQGPRPINAREFLDMLEVRTPASFIRSLNESFMFGVHVFDDNEPFLIFSVDAYDQAFAGMLAWEPFLADDLPLLVRHTTLAEEIRADESGTTTGGTLATPTTQTFTDIILKNRDVRALLDEHGNILMAYSFPDKNTLIIATNRNTLIEIFDRLAAARFR